MKMIDTGHAVRSLMLALCLGAALPQAVAQAEVTLYMMTMPPIVMEQPGRRGMVGDVVLEAMRRAGLQPRVRVEPNPRAMASVKQHEDLFITALSRIPAREQDYTWVAPILPIHRAFYALQRKADSYADAKASFLRIAVSRNTANHEILLGEGFTKEQLVEVNAGESAPRMLLAGRVDAWFNMEPESEALLDQIGAPALVKGNHLGSSELYLACSKKCDPDKVHRLAAALAAMKVDGTTQRLMMAYAAEPGYAAR
jgi:polar amino acid transport system substrate-binding protein